jgi:hypothetical protein
LEFSPEEEEAIRLALAGGAGRDGGAGGPGGPGRGGGPGGAGVRPGGVASTGAR